MPTQTDIQFVKKITTKNVIGDKKVILEAAEKGKGKTVALYRVIGSIAKMSTKTTDFGESMKFEGTIEATLIDGSASFRSGVLFLPSPLDTMLAGQIAEVESGTVEFAAEIGVKTNDTPIGYEYTVKPLLDTGAADPLAGLRESVAALPAPKK